MRFLVLVCFLAVFSFAKLTPLQLAHDINEFSKEKLLIVRGKIYSQKELEEKATSYTKAITLFLNSRFKTATIQDALTKGENSSKNIERELIAFFISTSDVYQSYPIQTRLEVLKAVKESMSLPKYKPYWENMFNLSGILQNEYIWTDKIKSIKKQIETLKYLLKHYEEYKELYIYNYADVESHAQPDVWSEFFIDLMKFELESNNDREKDALLKEYSKLLRELYTKARKDITYYKIENVKKVLADKSSVKVHPYFKKIYEDMQKRYDKKEYFWFETTFCEDENRNHIYTYVPNYEKGKTSHDGKFIKNCFLDKKTPFSGTIVNYYENGKVEYVIPFKDGFKHGWYKRYHKNGQIRNEGKYEGGIPVGVHKDHWVDNKHKLKETTYKNGLKHTFVNHFSDGTKRYITYDKYGHSIAKDIKNLDKNGQTDCFDDEHILKYKDYECLIAKYSFNQELKPIDNHVNREKLDDILEKFYVQAANLNDLAWEYYKKNPNAGQILLIKALLQVSYDEQIQKVIDMVLVNKSVELLVYELMKTEAIRKGFEGNIYVSGSIVGPREFMPRDKRVEEIIALVNVSLAYKELHDLKSMRLFPKTLAKDESDYGKKLYQEIQYRLVEFLKNQKGIF